MAASSMSSRLRVCALQTRTTRVRSVLLCRPLSARVLSPSCSNSNPVISSIWRHSSFCNSSVLFHRSHLGNRSMSPHWSRLYSTATTGNGDTAYYPRRAVMYVPASDERKTKKAASLNVDTLVFDLEDGVAVNQKENARNLVRTAVAECQTSGSKAEHVVRINGVESGMMQSDLEAVFWEAFTSWGFGGAPNAIMLPKCDTAEQLAELDLALSFHNLSRRSSPIPLYVIIESPVGLLNLRDVCHFGTQSAKHLKLSAVVFGSDDFLAMLGGTRTKSASELLYARQSVVTHAKAFGLDAIDLVDIDYKDLASLKDQSEEGARMGYTGKQVIHPDQVPVVQEAFSPSSAQTKWATELIEAFHQHQQTGKGAFVFQGHMIDKPLLLQAENIVKLQQAISNTTS